VATIVDEVDDVESVDTTVEDVERSGEVVEALTQVTLVITTATGGVAAARALIDQIADAVKSARGLKQALVETDDGPQPLT
jgi:hypothetical protein